MAAGWSSSQPLRGLAVAHEDFGVGVGGGEEFGPDVGGDRSPRSPETGTGRVERVELFDAAAEEGDERAGLALGLEGVVDGLHGGALGEDEVAAAVDVGDEVLGLRRR